MVKRKVREFLFGEESILDIIFKVPPKKPDSRMYFLGGCGLITIFRGAYILFGRPPVAEIFDALGSWFIYFWAWVWIFVGIAVMIVAGTGHWRAELDRAAAFFLMGIWWMWAALYFISAVLPHNEDRLADFLNGCVLGVTGIVLSAGIIQGIRKTQEIRLKQLAMEELRLLNLQTLVIVEENRRMRQLLSDNNITLGG